MANGETFTIGEDAGVFTGNVLDNDVAGSTVTTNLPPGTTGVYLGGTYSGLYGTLVISENGAFTYTLSAGIEATLFTGQTVTETVTYAVAEPVAGGGVLNEVNLADLEIEIVGASAATDTPDDEATIIIGRFGASGNVLGNDGVAAGDVTAVNGQAVSDTPIEVAGQYGTLTIGADGAWSYSVDYDATAAFAAAAGGIATDSFQIDQLVSGILAEDSQTLDVNIDMTGLVPVVGSGGATGDSGLAGGGAGRALIIGTTGVDIVDADNGGRDVVIAGLGDDTIEFGGAVTVLAGSGDDTIRGGDDTGEANARIFAGDGDDTIYWNDSVVRVNGGAGRDTIHFDDPAQVGVIDLAAESIERAIVRFSDPTGGTQGGRLTTRESYDADWNLLQTYVVDQGVRSVTRTFDEGGTVASVELRDIGPSSFFWSTATNIYSAAGNLVERTVVSDNGIVNVTAFADEAGRTRLSITTEDGPDDLRPWTSLVTAFDEATGELESRTWTFDDGDVTKVEFTDFGRVTSRTDNADDAFWQTLSVTRDEAGQLVESYVVEDDGDIGIKSYDFRGRLSEYVIQDVSDSRPWEVRIISYDTSGNVVGNEFLTFNEYADLIA